MTDPDLRLRLARLRVAERLEQRDAGVTVSSA
jgi:hypothetical protein